MPRDVFVTTESRPASEGTFLLKGRKFHPPGFNRGFVLRVRYMQTGCPFASNRACAPFFQPQPGLGGHGNKNALLDQKPMFTITEHDMQTDYSLTPTSFAVAKRFIHDRTARIGIVGLGYTGLRSAILFSKASFAVDGFDLDPSKVENLQSRRSYLAQIPSDAVSLARDRGFRATTDFRQLHETDVVVLCTSARFDDNRCPDLTNVREAAFNVASNLHAGHLVIVGSTTYPGCTEEVIVPILEGANSEHLKVSYDSAAPDEIFVGVSPDSFDPRDITMDQSEIPKIVAGIDRFGAQLTADLYGTVSRKIVPVSNPSTAELTGLLESTYRSVNIALASELKHLCLRMGLDPSEAMSAASSKPFESPYSFQDPGVNCPAIRFDSLSLAWRARAYAMRARLIELASEINNSTPEFDVRRIEEALNQRGKPLNGSRILLLGIACQNDSENLHDSPSLAMMNLLCRAGALVDYNDPFLPEIARGLHDGLERTSVPIHDVSGYDAVLITADHHSNDLARILAQAKLVIDTQNVTRRLASEKIVRC
jgi:UDP-N-acetyl-D-glucosamine dehydrogenase